ASPAAIPLWDEQLISDVRGYPAGVAFDRSRLIFYGFPLVPRGVLWSEIGTIDAFNLGALATDAIFETLPLNCVVRHVTGGADQFVWTDSGVCYIPISGGTPLVPGSVEFRAVESEAVGAAVPVQTIDGIVFINEGGNRV